MALNTLMLGAAAAGSAAAKIRRVPQVVETLTSVGVKEEQINVLAAIELLGALGLLVGAKRPRIGSLAALGLTTYFAAAAASHVKVGDTPQNTGPAAGLALLGARVVRAKKRAG